MARKRGDVELLTRTAPFDRLRRQALRPLAAHVDRIDLPQGTVLVREDRPVRLPHEVQHLREVIEVIEGGQYWQLHGTLFLGRNRGMFYFCSKMTLKVNSCGLGDQMTRP